MRIYVFGGSRDDCIELANRLNGSGVTALIGKGEEEPRDIAGMIGKSVDCAMMISEDPIRSSVQANRDPKIRAAVCYNQKSLKSAAAEAVNMFIMEPDSLERLDFSVLGGGKPASPLPDNAIATPAGPGLFKSVTNAILPREKPAKAEREPEPREKPEKRVQRKQQEDDQEDEPHRSAGSGLGGRIKDIFGIEE
ncbi:MAG: hypothetical protein KGH94_02335 [Candidatus Micrarchaeota archaeon]|nr:hypothetical protein [Candidatus Micrarchaeota archaeon]